MYPPLGIIDRDDDDDFDGEGEGRTEGGREGGSSRPICGI